MNAGLPVLAHTERRPGALSPGQRAGSTVHLTQLTCRQLLGTLLQPVSAQLVIEQFGISAANVYQLRRIYADWPAGNAEDFPVMPQDQLVLPAGSYTVVGVQPFPGDHLLLLVEVPLP